MRIKFLSNKKGSHVKNMAAFFVCSFFTNINENTLKIKRLFMRGLIGKLFPINI